MGGDPRSVGSGPASDGGPPLTIGLYSPGWPPSGFANGIVTYVEAVAEGMVRLGHRPVVLAGRVVEGDPAGEGRVPVIDLGPFCEPSAGARLVDRIMDRARRPSCPIGIRRLAKGIVRFARGAARLDVLEVEESFGLPGLVAGRVPVPVVARLHGPWFLNGPNQGGDPESPAFARRVRDEGEALRKVDGITAPSRDVLSRTKAYYGLAMAGSEAIANPVLLVPADRRWRRDGCEPGHLLFVGRFDRHKGGDTVIDAFAALSRSLPEARLTFVGPDRGIDRDGRRWSLPEYLEHRLPGAAEGGRVRWLGRRTPEEIAALRTKAAVTVVASRYETFAITVTEAMACGCPLVATRAGGAGELFEDRTHGLYVEPEDPGALASAIGELLADPGRAASLGAAAEAHCRRRYAPEVIAEQMIRFYRRVLAGPAARHPLPEEARP